MKDTKNIEVRFRDVDVLGHVNNAVYFSYFEQARISFFAKINGADWDWNEGGVLLVRNEIDYMSPVFLNDKVSLLTQTVDVGNKSFTLSYEVYAERNGDKILCSKGLSVLVCYDHISGKSATVPDLWRRKMLEA